jgi:hypothetical protein
MPELRLELRRGGLALGSVDRLRLLALDTDNAKRSSPRSASRQRGSRSSAGVLLQARRRHLARSRVVRPDRRGQLDQLGLAEPGQPPAAMRRCHLRLHGGSAAATPRRRARVAMSASVTCRHLEAGAALRAPNQARRLYRLRGSSISSTARAGSVPGEAPATPGPTIGRPRILRQSLPRAEG